MQPLKKEEVNYEEEIAQFANIYQFLGKQDRHLIRIFHWTKVLEALADEVRSCDSDQELEDELRKLASRLISEMSIRLWGIMKERIGSQ